MADLLKEEKMKRRNVKAALTRAGKPGGGGGGGGGGVGGVS